MERRDIKRKKNHKIKISLDQKMFPVSDLRCVTILQIISPEMSLSWYVFKSYFGREISQTLFTSKIR